MSSRKASEEVISSSTHNLLLIICKPHKRFSVLLPTIRVNKIFMKNVLSGKKPFRFKRFKIYNSCNKYLVSDKPPYGEKNYQSWPCIIRCQQFWIPNYAFYSPIQPIKFSFYYKQGLIIQFYFYFIRNDDKGFFVLCVFEVSLTNSRRVSASWLGIRLSVWYYK